MKIMYGGLIAIPLACAAEFLHWNGGLIFLFSAIAIVPLAAILGDATEQVAFYTGPKIGGMLNATMGNVPELLIGFFAVKAGLFSLVLASMIGSVIGNTLLVLGASALVGGLFYKNLTYNTNIPKLNFTLLLYGLFGMVLPAIISFSKPDISKGSLNIISIGVAIALIIVYLLNLYFSLFTHKEMFEEVALAEEGEDTEEEGAKWSLGKAIGVLAVASFFVAVMSEFLVDSVEVVVTDYGLPEAFIGIIIIPILGNVAEHAAAVLMAAKDKMNISVEIAVGSGTQISLFVAPLLVVISFLLGTPMPYVFTPFELICLAFGVGVGGYMLLDGKTNWLEGAMLMGVYALVALGFYFI